MQLTEGLCGHKRTLDWISDRVLDPDFATSRILDYVNGEYRTLSLLVVMPDSSDIKALNETIHGCVDDTGMLRQVVISTRNPNVDDDKRLLEYLNDNVTKSWTIDAIRREDDINLFAMANYSARTVKNFWFLPIMAGDTLRPKQIEEVYDSLGDPFTNWMAFYFDDEDQFKVVANTVAFTAMEGHYDMPWLKKVQEFDNWESVCKKII